MEIAYRTKSWKAIYLRHLLTLVASTTADGVILKILTTGEAKATPNTEMVLVCDVDPNLLKDLDNSPAYVTLMINAKICLSCG